MNFRSDLNALILSILSERSAHGYEISKRIRALSGDVFKYGEGQLYPALAKLESEGVISAEWIEQSNRPPRKVYSITPSGINELENLKNGWKKFTSAVDSIMNRSTAKENK